MTILSCWPRSMALTVRPKAIQVPSYKFPTKDGEKAAAPKSHNLMANSKDFFSELNKQLTALRSTK